MVTESHYQRRSSCYILSTLRYNGTHIDNEHLLRARGRREEVARNKPEQD
jgi:hypothetical protein